jgi:predicted naringenin-chalcone synthase
MSFITAIGTAVPTNRFKQSTIADFMVKAMQLDYAGGRKLKTIFQASGIEHRHSVLSDFGKQKDFSFFPNTPDFEPFPSTERRIEEFQKHALLLSTQAIQNCLAGRRDFKFNSVTHLITVSCTGMYAPGLDIELVKQLGLRMDVQRTAINFMGCYAAFNAIKAGDAFCKAHQQNKVLIVCIEMCSLHFQKESSNDNLLANGLFSDGSAAVLMESEPNSGWNLLPAAFHNALSFTDEQHMAWGIGNFGFEMKLSSYVPDIVQAGIRNLATEMMKKINRKISDIDYFAIHPGGKRILEVIEKELGIKKEQNLAAYQTLINFGNMSSPTVLFVLKDVLRNLKTENNNSHVLSFAFGPGLTLESILFNAEYVS